MSDLEPLLISYGDRRCRAPSSVDPLPQLVLFLAQNELMLREDTLTDGNCGVHAFCLSLIDFADRNPAIRSTLAWKQFSKVRLNTSNAIKHLREVGVKWMTDHVIVPVWDGMLFRDLACAMSHLREPYDLHLRRMACDKQWVDASVIHALACVFRVDIAIWQDPSEPTMVGYSMLSQGTSFGLVTIALKNDLHFWGVVVADTSNIKKSDRLIEIEDWVALPRAITERSNVTDADDDADNEMSVAASLDIAPARLNTEEVDSELQLCKCLATWVPWSAPTDDVNMSLAAIRSPTTARRCMVREQVVADMIWEAAHADVLPTRMRYHAASRYRLQTGRVSPSRHVAKNTYMVATEALQTHALIDASLIPKQLDKPCSKHGRPHSCMDVFKADPHIVRVWRVMWRCVPAALRREKLIDMMTPSFQQHNDSCAGGNWTMVDYSFLGQPVCREAFRLLTGIGQSSLTRAKESVMQMRRTSSARSELSHWLDIVATNKPKLYLDARQWLEYYADTHAEQSPISLTSYLPGGRKQFYHLIYERDRQRTGQLAASLRVFLEAWRCETPWIVIPRRIGQFLKCGLCEWLKLQIDRCPRNQPELRELLKNRLGTHFSFQSAQRLIQSRIKELCKQSNGRKVFMETDKMDEKACVVPTEWSQLSTQFFQSGERLVVAINGSFYHGCEHSQVHIRTMFEDIEHGSEMQMSTFLLNFHESVLLEKRVPEELVLGADNTSKETKNKYGCWWCMWLLCVFLVAGVPLHSILMCFLLVGHTHDEIDRFFQAACGDSWQELLHS